MGEVVFVIVPVGALIAFCVWYYSEEEKIARALRKAPASTIRDAPAGAIMKLVGRIQPTGEVLRAPFTDRPCVFYEARVEEKLGNTYWTGATFMLEVRTSARPVYPILRMPLPRHYPPGHDPQDPRAPGRARRAACTGARTRPHRDTGGWSRRWVAGQSRCSDEPEGTWFARGRLAAWGVPRSTGSCRSIRVNASRLGTLW